MGLRGYSSDELASEDYCPEFDDICCLSDGCSWCDDCDYTHGLNWAWVGVGVGVVGFLVAYLLLRK